MRTRSGKLPAVFLLPLVIAVAAAFGQEIVPGGRDQDDQGEISLRKTVHTREYQGKEIEVEERVVGRGDSLWGILIREKGLSEKRFGQYVVLIKGLNPQMKSRSTLQVGENLFIPLQPDVALGSPVRRSKEKSPTRLSFGKGAVQEYRVKAGDRLYQILREQLGLRDERELAVYYALVRDLNPAHRNWDHLEKGEVIRLPVRGAPGESGSAVAGRTVGVRQLGKEPPRPPAATDVGNAGPGRVAERPIDPRQLRARENMVLLAQVAGAIGAELQSEGHEEVAFTDGAIRIDKDTFPVVYNPRLGQKVVIDVYDRIPATLRTRLGDPNVAIPVMALAERTSVYEAVGQLLARLGFQALPNDRPVVVQEGGIAYEAKGTWMALAPEESNKPQEIFILTLADQSAQIPEDLRTHLASKGLHLKEITDPLTATKTPVKIVSAATAALPEVRTWPREKAELVDEILLAYGIPFGVAERLTVEVEQGLEASVRSDRIFELQGKQTALLFQPGEPAVKKALQEHHGIRVVDLDLRALSARELIGRLLNELGEQVSYRENRFAASSGGRERLTVSAWGFLLPQRSLFLTDREIPQRLHRFFFEKGLQIVYFH